MPATYINPSQVKAIVSDEATPLFVADGFTAIDRFKFIRSSKAPIREVVLIGFGRSDCSLSCGWSLTFVPLIQGARLRWQRTEKSIRVFDVTCSPWGWDRRFKWPDWSVSMFNDEIACRAKAKDLARKVVAHAADWWNRISTVDDVIDLVLSLRQPDAARFLGYWNLPRLQLTLAFANAFSGRREHARSALDEYFSHYSGTPPDIKVALTKALATTGSVHSPGAVGE